jgi:hypothetical protein
MDKGNETLHIPFCVKQMTDAWFLVSVGLLKNKDMHAISNMHNVPSKDAIKDRTVWNALHTKYISELLKNLRIKGENTWEIEGYLVPGIHVQAASNNGKHNKTRLPASLEELLKTSRIEWIFQVTADRSNDIYLVGQNLH